MRGIALAVSCLLAAASAKAADIGAIQGAAHASPEVGERVEAEGVVTLMRGNGFFLQDAPDADAATSDGIFVFTSAVPDVSVGDRIRVEGRVVEFTPSNRPQQLSLTEIAEPEVVVLERDAPLPDPVLLGPGGRVPPSEVIDDDGLASFEPETDGIDFYESLEGMRVTIEDAIALNPVERLQRSVGGSGGGKRLPPASTAATPSSCARRDFNPERVLLDLELVDVPPGIEAGARIGTATGVLDYAFGNFRIQVTRLGEDRGVTDPDRLSIGSYNVENLDPVIEDRALVARRRRRR